MFGTGFALIGLALDCRLDASRYEHCTPNNCRTFAGTRCDGIHFSLLIQNGTITEDSPVVMTFPGDPAAPTLVAGESLYDFLCLGSHQGFFALEWLIFRRGDPCQPYKAGGHVQGREENFGRILQFLVDRFDLRPWRSLDRLAQLEKRYASLLQLPPDMLEGA